MAKPRLLNNIIALRMPYNEVLVNRISEALVGIKNVVTKKMFRGIAFMVNDKMCITVSEHDIMCRIDPAIHEELVEKTGCRSMVMKGKELKGWVLVNEEAIKSKKDLDYWISLALSFNKYAKSSKKAKR